MLIVVSISKWQVEGMRGGFIWGLGSFTFWENTKKKIGTWKKKKIRVDHLSSRLTLEWLLLCRCPLRGGGQRGHHPAGTRTL